MYIYNAYIYIHQNENFNPVGTYDDFSFNKHYMKLLTGKWLSTNSTYCQQHNESSHFFQWVVNPYWYVILHELHVSSRTQWIAFFQWVVILFSFNTHWNETPHGMSFFTNSMCRHELNESSTLFHWTNTSWIFLLVQGGEDAEDFVCLQIISRKRSL